MELQLRNRQINSGGSGYRVVSPSSFAQQGTVDWPALAGASINASVSFLTRLSGCGVELWTAAVAQVIFGNLQIGVEGDKRIRHELSKLHSFGSFGNLMHFGIGIKHIVRTLADSAEGMATVALCAALVEAHSTTVSVEILQEFAKLYYPDDEGTLVPSFRQWEALLVSCSGVLSTSPFGSIIEFFVRLDSIEVQPLSGEPKEIAKALEGLAKISTGLMKSMVLEGHSECGFLAAFAYWVLGLRVTVKNAAEETVFPTIGSKPEDWQLMVILTGPNESEVPGAVIRKANTYYVKRIIDIFPHDDSNYCYLSGRVDWVAALEQTFGAAATRLLKAPKILGEIIGSAAKIYTAYPTRLNADLPGIIGHNCRLGPESSGRAFIDLALRSLPELKGSQSTIRTAVELPYGDAMLEYEKAILLLREICDCPKYYSAIASSSKDDHNSNDGDGLPTKEPKGPSIMNYNRLDDTYFCLPLLAVTIIQFVRQLSVLGKTPSGLCPKRRGIQCIYHAVESASVAPLLRPDVVSSRFTYLLEFMSSGDLISTTALTFAAYNNDDTLFGMLTDRDGISARAVNGLCFVLDSLLGLSDKAEDMLRVHIVPGCIEFRGKPYTLVRDGNNTAPLSILEPLILPTSTATYKTQMKLIHTSTTRAVVTEASDSLRMSYEIKTSSGTCMRAPKELAFDMTMAANPVSCSGKRCRPLTELSKHFLFTLSPMRLPYEDAWMARRIPDDRAEKANICLLGNNITACCASLNQFKESKVIL